jgi:hypothetical protein
MRPEDTAKGQSIVLVHTADELSRELWPIVTAVGAELGVNVASNRWSRKLAQVTPGPAILFMDGSKVAHVLPLQSFGSGDTLLADWRRIMGSRAQKAVVARQRSARHQATSREDNYLLEGNVFVFDLEKPKPPEDNYLVLGQ